MAINNQLVILATKSLQGFALGIIGRLFNQYNANKTYNISHIAVQHTTARKGRRSSKHQISLGNLNNPISDNLITMLFLKSIETNNIANNNAQKASFAAREAAKKLDVASNLHSL